MSCVQPAALRLWQIYASGAFVSSAPGGHPSRLLVLLWLGGSRVSSCGLCRHVHAEEGPGSGLIP